MAVRQHWNSAAETVMGTHRGMAPCSSVSIAAGAVRRLRCGSLLSSRVASTRKVPHGGHREMHSESHRERRWPPVRNLSWPTAVSDVGTHLFRPEFVHNAKAMAGCRPMRIHIQNPVDDPLFLFSRTMWDEAAARAPDVGTGHEV